MNRISATLFLMGVAATPSSSAGFLGTDLTGEATLQTRETAQTVDASDQVLKDSRGREISRIHWNADGSQVRTSTQHGEGLALTRAIESLDKRGRVIRKILERVDSVGRSSERREIDIDERGNGTGRLLRYSYDGDRQRVQTTPITEEAPRQ